MKYRAEIDGLRALAIIPVIFFHAGFSGFSGGFLGVDVFFVISGYLITTIILAEKDGNTFSLKSFYDRRARRILPALYFMLFIVSIFAFLLMLPSQLKEFGQSLIATVLFSANFFFWIKTDYWAQSAELTPLLHIWSLGVEEQFYLVFPLIVIFIKPNKLRVIFFSILTLSFFSMLLVRDSGNLAEAFYLLPFRTWELIAGAIAVLWKNKLQPSNNKKINFIALITLLLSFIIFNEHTNSIFLFGIPVLATFFIVAIPVENGIVADILKNSFLVYIGTISYSLYLFHQPIFALLRIATFGPLSLPLTVLSILITFLMAMISFRFIETPFKNHSIYSNKFITFSSLFIIISFLILGGIFHFSNGMRSYTISKMEPNTKLLFMKYELTKKNREEIWENLTRNSGVDFEKSNKLKILFVGDSLSEDLMVASRSSKYITDKAEIRRIDFDDECIKNLITNGSEIGNRSTPCQIERQGFLNSSLVKESDVIIIAEGWFSNAKYLEDFLRLPEIKNKEVVVYLTHSFSDMTSLLLYIAKSKVNFNSSEFKKFVYSSKNQRNTTANATLQDIAIKYHLSTINAYNFFCDDYLKECTVIDDADFPMIIDQTHLSGAGIEKFSPWFSIQLKNTLHL